MQRYNGQLINQFPNTINGNAAAGAQITVRVKSSGALASLYATDNLSGAALSNPLTADSRGYYGFYAPDGVYTLDVSISGTPQLEIQLQDVAALQAQFDDALANAGYIPVGTFAAGCTVSQSNGVVSDGSAYWRWDGALPKTVTAGSEPTPTGAGGWVLISDEAFRGALAAIDSTELIAGVEANYIASKTRRALSSKPIGLSLFSTSSAKNIMFIGDSLTQGAGGSTPIDIIKNSVRSVMGDGGYGYSRVGNGIPQYFKIGMETAPLTPESIYSQYCPDFGCTFSDDFSVDDLTTFGFDTDWDEVDIYYLKQPSGATFIADHSNKVPSEFRYTINTNSPSVSLGKFTLTKQFGYNGEIAIKHSANGKLVIIGALPKLTGNNKSVVTVLAEGGRKALDFANINAGFATEFYSAINPDLVFINLGMNDRLTRTANQIVSDITTIISRLPTTSSVVLIACNESIDDSESSLPEYRLQLKDFANSNGYGFIDNTHVLGNYAEAVAKGLMLDGVHPNSKGNALIAAGYLAYLGMPYYLPTTARTPYDSGASSDSYKYKGDLTKKEGLAFTSGVPVILYRIGLHKAFTHALLNAHVLSEVNDAMLKTKHEIMLRNGTTSSNKVTEILKTTNSELFRRNRPSGPEVVINTTLSVNIVNDLAEISVVFTGGNGNFSVFSDYEFARLIETGVSVYEN